MSRHSISNQRYTFAFGVDHFCSTFFQIWDRDWDDPEDADRPLVDVDSRLGIRIADPLHLSFSGKLCLVLGELKKMWEQSQQRGVPHPNMGEHTIVDVARALGLAEKDVAPKVYELWGGEA